MHVSRKERAELNKLFIGVLKKSTSVTLLLCAGLILLVQYCSMCGLHFTQRIPAVDTLICLALVTVANSVVFSFALYMRAHKEEPMLAISLGSALLTLLVIYLGARISIVVMMGLYAAVTALVTLPWTAFVFLKYFNRIDGND
jgi:O-antigen/teichoic acid export membrane protein